MTDAPIRISTASEAETAALGAVLGNWLQPGDILLLHGDLGAGKTTLARSIAAALGVAGVVSSPSFALVNEYAIPGDQPLRQFTHLDLYRLEADDLDSFGFADLLAVPNAVTLIEWPERAIQFLPDRYLLVEITITGPAQRQFLLTAVPADLLWLGQMDELRRRIGAGPGT